MPIVCSVCNLSCTTDGTEVKCSGTCKRCFHADCLKDELDGVKTRANKDWKCGDCKKGTISSKGSSTSSTQQTPITKEFMIKMMEGWKNDLSGELKSVRKEMADMSASMQFLSDGMDSTNTIMSEIKSQLSSLQKENSALKLENKWMKTELENMKERMRSIEQYSRRTNLEISGLPVTPKENVEELVQDVGKALGVELKESQVITAHRIPSYKKDRTPAVIVQFTTKGQREAWIGKYKQKKILTADEVNAAFTKQRVYVNEHLTPENKQFLAKLKEKCRNIGFKYAWCRDGKFFVRKSDGERCTKINSYDEMDQLK